MMIFFTSSKNGKNVNYICVTAYKIYHKDKDESEIILHIHTTKLFSVTLSNCVSCSFEADMRRISRIALRASSSMLIHLGSKYYSNTKLIPFRNSQEMSRENKIFSAEHVCNLCFILGVPKLSHVSISFNMFPSQFSEYR